MATDIELALMAGRAYQSTRKDPNWFPSPQGWEEKRPEHEESGFEAVYFQRGTGENKEIVISFAGTYFDPDRPIETSKDFQTDIALGAGHYSEQLKQAAEYYLKKKGTDLFLTSTSVGDSLPSCLDTPD